MKAPKVVELAEVRRAPLEDVVATCKHLLTEAKAGRLRSLAYSGTGFDQDSRSITKTGVAWGEASQSEIVGSLQLLKWELTRTWSEGGEVVDTPDDGGA